MAFAVVSGFDESVFSRLDWLVREIADSAAATCVDIGNEQRSVARVGEMERISDHFALKDSAKFVFRFVEGDDGFFARRLFGRLWVVDQLG